MKIDFAFLKKKPIYKKENISFRLNLSWNIVLYSFFVIVIFGFIFGLALYQRVNKDSFYTVSPDVFSNDSESTLLMNGLDFFKKRQEKSEQILSIPISVVDPAR